MPIKYLNRSRGSLGSSFYDFTLGSLPSGVSFTRASTGYRYNASGVLVSETTDVPRFDYDPVTLASRGLLLEDAATSLVTYSEQMNNAAWGKTGGTISADTATAPDGTLTADALVENSATSLHNVGRIPTYANATTYVHAARFKPDTRGWVALFCDTGRFGGGGYTYFNLTTGAVGSVSAGMTPFIVQDAAGFWVCAVIGTTISSGGGNFSANLATGNGGATYSGDGVSKAFVWGINIVAADVLSSYIKTVGATATRAADIALITNPSGLADQCKVIKFRTPRRISGGAVNVAWQRDDGTTNNRELVRYGSDGKIHVIASVGGVDQCDLDMGAVAADTDVTIAARFTAGAFAASLNGGAIVTYAGGSRPSGLTTERLGKGVSGFALNSTLRSLWSLPTASNTDLPLLAA